MGWFGLGLLVLAMVLMATTGWPTYAVLLGVSSLGALVGLVDGTITLPMLSALPGRMVGLLNLDLLQALVIYGLAGALLVRLDLADITYRGLRRQLEPHWPRAASVVSGLALGALMAPTNGSAAASVTALARSTGTRWTEDGLAPARTTALVAVAGTLGVLIPPSLVLLLLGDAALRAHTEGLALAAQLGLATAREGLRVINTQDVMQAVLVPCALLLMGWLAVAVWTSRNAHPPSETSPASPRERVAVVVVPTFTAALLGLIAAGFVRPVEGAATAGVVLLAWGLVSRQLTADRFAAVLDDALVLTGVLFGLLVAATTLSMLLRLLGTDRLVASLMASTQNQPPVILTISLAVMLLCSFVLDAFEIVFLVVPILMPPVLAQVSDAAWVTTLTLLVLQLGFLLPPFGYSLVLSRGLSATPSDARAVAREVLPYLLWLGLVIATVAAWPDTTRWLRSTPMHLESDGAMDPAKIEERLRQMSAPADAPAR